MEDADNNDKTGLPDESSTVDPADNDKSQTSEAQDPPQENDESNNLASDPNSKPDDVNHSEIKAVGEKKHERSSSYFRPPDLKEISEEIDQYISSLLKSQGEVSSSPPDVPIFVEQFMILVEAKIEDYEEKNVKWTRLTEEDSSSFLQAVNRVSSLSKALWRFSSEYKYACSINRISSVLQRAMSYLEEEFKSILEDHMEPNQDPGPVPDNNNNNHNLGYTKQIIMDLIRIANAMISGGYEIECCHVYFLVRRNALDESLNRIGFEKHTIDDVHRMNLETLEKEIETWIRLFRQFMSNQFSTERKLSCAVFSAHPETSRNVFGSLLLGVITQLLNFAQAVALTKRSVEKLFKFIDVYEVVQNMSIEGLFPEEMAVQIKNESSMIKSRLGESMIMIFAELENSIKADSGKSVPGGAVHPLTKYIMNYLEYACEYKNTLEQVFREHDNTASASSSPNQDESPFQAQVIRVLDLLNSNIEGKSRLYKDPALNSIFMMNNGRYMLKKIKGNHMNSLIGDGWYRKKSSDIRQYHKGYQRDTWGKLLNCFNPEGLTVNGKVMKPALKERFKTFNSMFDDIHKTQSHWVVGDKQLQSELRVSISNMVIPAYRSFLGRYSQTFTPGRQTEKYVKFQPDDIEKYVDELFDGTAAPSGKKNKQ